MRKRTGVGGRASYSAKPCCFCGARGVEEGRVREGVKEKTDRETETGVIQHTIARVVAG